jgi:phage-related protein
MRAKEFYRGAWGAICLATQPDGTSLASVFIAELDTAERTKLLALLKRTADMGPRNINDGTKFKKLEGNLFEFKSFQVRMPCFYDGRLIVLTHGFKKKQDNTPRTEIDRASKIQHAYEIAKEAPSPKKPKR